MENKKRYILSLIVAILVVISLGTYAWLTYRTNDTAMVLTIGDINNVRITMNPYQIDANLSPNLTYIGQPYTTVEVVNNSLEPKGIKLYYKINAIDSELATSNLKYTIEKKAVGSSSYTHITPDGNFAGATKGDIITVVDEEVPVGTTYYKVYVWLYSASSAQNNVTGKRFNAELGADTKYHVYTSNLYDRNATGWNSVWIGQKMPDGITAYNTPEAAMTALETEYSYANNGAIAKFPFFLRHTVTDGSLWCAVNSSNEISACVFESQSECNSNVLDYFGEGFVCQEKSVSGGVTESYVGFVVTPAMVTANSGMVAGTYYLRGGDIGRSFLDNAKMIYDAFGGTDASEGVNCFLDGNLGGNPYVTTPYSSFCCYASGFGVEAYSNGIVDSADDFGSNCGVDNYGISNCLFAD